MLLTIPQTITLAKQAGFSGNGLQRIVAIAICESGLETSRVGVSDPNDRGLTQINRKWHPEVSDACAFNGLCNLQQAYRISSNGTNFNQWTTYTNGCSNSKMSLVGQYMSNGSTTSVNYPLWTKPFMAQSVTWWEQNGHHYPKDWGALEGGVDWNPVPLNAPITALLSGTVVGSGYFCKPYYYCGSTYVGCAGSQGYGVVTIRSTNPRPDLVPGQFIDVYYQHIIIDGSIGITCSGASGQQIKQGQVIGRGNGEFNVEVGVNVGTQWGRIWGGSSPGPHVDPIPFLHAIISSGGDVGSSLGFGGSGGVGSLLGFIGDYHSISVSAHDILNNVPGFLGICEALDLLEQFQPFRLPAVSSSSSNAVTGAANIVSSVGQAIAPVLGPVGPILLSPLDSSIKGLASQYSKVVNPLTLPADAMQAGITFLVTNIGAALFRGTLIIIGTIIVIALMINLINPGENTEELLPLIAALL